jgi:Fe-S-cluster containining protein
MGCVLCEHCSALCCQYIALEIDEPDTARDYDDIRWYLMHEDMSVFVEDGDWYLQINRRCKNLLPDNRCGIYETRPEICREYTTEDCDYHGGPYDYDHLFKEPAELEAFAAEALRKKKARKHGNGGVKKKSSKRGAKLRRAS